MNSTNNNNNNQNKENQNNNKSKRDSSTSSSNSKKGDKKESVDLIKKTVVNYINENVEEGASKQQNKQTNASKSADNINKSKNEKNTAKTNESRDADEDGTDSREVTVNITNSGNIEVYGNLSLLDNTQSIQNTVNVPIVSESIPETMPETLSRHNHERIGSISQVGSSDDNSKQEKKDTEKRIPSELISISSHVDDMEVSEHVYLVVDQNKPKSASVSNQSRVPSVPNIGETDFLSLVSINDDINEFADLPNNASIHSWETWDSIFLLKEIDTNFTRTKPASLTSVGVSSPNPAAAIHKPSGHKSAEFLALSIMGTVEDGTTKKKSEEIPSINITNVESGERKSSSKKKSLGLNSDSKNLEQNPSKQSGAPLSVNDIDVSTIANETEPDVHPDSLSNKEINAKTSDTFKNDKKNAVEPEMRANSPEVLDLYKNPELSKQKMDESQENTNIESTTSANPNSNQQSPKDPLVGQKDDTATTIEPSDLKKKYSNDQKRTTPLSLNDLTISQVVKKSSLLEQENLSWITMEKVELDEINKPKSLNDLVLNKTNELGPEDQQSSMSNFYSTQNIQPNTSNPDKVCASEILKDIITMVELSKNVRDSNNVKSGKAKSKTPENDFKIREPIDLQRKASSDHNLTTAISLNDLDMNQVRMSKSMLKAQQMTAGSKDYETVDTRNKTSIDHKFNTAISLSSIVTNQAGKLSILKQQEINAPPGAVRTKIANAVDPLPTNEKPDDFHNNQNDIISKTEKENKRKDDKEKRPADDQKMAAPINLNKFDTFQHISQKEESTRTSQENEGKETIPEKYPLDGGNEHDLEMKVSDGQKIEIPISLNDLVVNKEDLNEEVKEKNKKLMSREESFVPKTNDYQAGSTGIILNDSSKNSVKKTGDKPKKSLCPKASNQDTAEKENAEKINRKKGDPSELMKGILSSIATRKSNRKLGKEIANRTNSETCTTKKEDPLGEINRKQMENSNLERKISDHRKLVTTSISLNDLDMSSFNEKIKLAEAEGLDSDTDMKNIHRDEMALSSEPFASNVNDHQTRTTAISLNDLDLNQIRAEEFETKPDIQLYSMYKSDSISDDWKKAKTIDINTSFVIHQTVEYERSWMVICLTESGLHDGIEPEQTKNESLPVNTGTPETKDQEEIVNKSYSKRVVWNSVEQKHFKPEISEVSELSWQPISLNDVELYKNEPEINIESDAPVSSFAHKPESKDQEKVLSKTYRKIIGVALVEHTYYERHKSEASELSWQPIRLQDVILYKNKSEINAQTDVTPISTFDDHDHIRSETNEPTAKEVALYSNDHTSNIKPTIDNIEDTDVEKVGIKPNPLLTEWKSAEPIDLNDSFMSQKSFSSEVTRIPISLNDVALYNVNPQIKLRDQKPDKWNLTEMVDLNNYYVRHIPESRETFWMHICLKGPDVSRIQKTEEWYLLESVGLSKYLIRQIPEVSETLWIRIDLKDLGLGKIEMTKPTIEAIKENTEETDVEKVVNEPYLTEWKLTEPIDLKKSFMSHKSFSSEVTRIPISLNDVALYNVNPQIKMRDQKPDKWNLTEMVDLNNYYVRHIPESRETFWMHICLKGPDVSRILKTEEWYLLESVGLSKYLIRNITEVSETLWIPIDLKDLRITPFEMKEPATEADALFSNVHTSNVKPVTDNIEDTKLEKVVNESYPVTREWKSAEPIHLKKGFMSQTSSEVTRIPISLNDVSLYEINPQRKTQGQKPDKWNLIEMVDLTKYYVRQIPELRETFWMHICLKNPGVSKLLRAEEWYLLETNGLNKYLIRQIPEVSETLWIPIDLKDLGLSKIEMKEPSTEADALVSNDHTSNIKPTIDNIEDTDVEKVVNKPYSVITEWKSAEPMDLNKSFMTEKSFLTEVTRRPISLNDVALYNINPQMKMQGQKTDKWNLTEMVDLNNYYVRHIPESREILWMHIGLKDPDASKIQKTEEWYLLESVGLSKYLIRQIPEVSETLWIRIDLKDLGLSKIEMTKPTIEAIKENIEETDVEKVVNAPYLTEWKLTEPIDLKKSFMSQKSFSSEVTRIPISLNDVALYNVNPQIKMRDQKPDKWNLTEMVDLNNYYVRHIPESRETFWMHICLKGPDVSRILKTEEWYLLESVGLSKYLIRNITEVGETLWIPIDLKDLRVTPFEMKEPTIEADALFSNDHTSNIKPIKENIDNADVEKVVNEPYPVLTKWKSAEPIDLNKRFMTQKSFSSEVTRRPISLNDVALYNVNPQIKLRDQKTDKWNLIEMVDLTKYYVRQIPESRETLWIPIDLKDLGLSKIELKEPLTEAAALFSSDHTSNIKPTIDNTEDTDVEKVVNKPYSVITEWKSAEPMDLNKSFVSKKSFSSEVTWIPISLNDVGLYEDLLGVIKDKKIKTENEDDALASAVAEVDESKFNEWKLAEVIELHENYLRKKSELWNQIWWTSFWFCISTVDDKRDSTVYYLELTQDIEKESKVNKSTSKSEEWKKLWKPISNELGLVKQEMDANTPYPKNDNWKTADPVHIYSHKAEESESLWKPSFLKYEVGPNIMLEKQNVTLTTAIEGVTTSFPKPDEWQLKETMSVNKDYLKQKTETWNPFWQVSINFDITSIVRVKSGIKLQFVELMEDKDEEDATKVSSKSEEGETLYTAISLSDFGFIKQQVDASTAHPKLEDWKLAEHNNMNNYFNRHISEECELLWMSIHLTEFSVRKIDPIKDVQKQEVEDATASFPETDEWKLVETINVNQEYLKQKAEAWNLFWQMPMNFDISSVFETKSDMNLIYFKQRQDIKEEGIEFSPKAEELKSLPKPMSLLTTDVIEAKKKTTGTSDDNSYQLLDKYSMDVEESSVKTKIKVSQQASLDKQTLYSVSLSYDQHIRVSQIPDHPLVDTVNQDEQRYKIKPILNFKSIENFDLYDKPKFASIYSLQTIPHSSGSSFPDLVSESDDVQSTKKLSCHWLPVQQKGFKPVQHYHVKPSNTPETRSDIDIHEVKEKQRVTTSMSYDTLAMHTTDWLSTRFLTQPTSSDIYLRNLKVPQFETFEINDDKPFRSLSIAMKSPSDTPESNSEYDVPKTETEIAPVGSYAEIHKVSVEGYFQSEEDSAMDTSTDKTDRTDKVYYNLTKRLNELGLAVKSKNAGMSERVEDEDILIERKCTCVDRTKCSRVDITAIRKE